MKASDQFRADGASRPGKGTSPDEAREIELLVSLLRSLPDPEPESDLTANVMRRVREIEARPRLLRPFFGQEAIRYGAALAAGIACVALGISLRSTPPPSDRVVDLAAMRAAAASARFPQRPLVPVVPDARAAALFSNSRPNTTMQGLQLVVPTNLLDHRLDAQLNELQLDPQAFFRRLERVQARDRFVQRLAERAARRGDATQVALNVRTVQHPLARPIVDQFLHASLVQQVQGR